MNRAPELLASLRREIENAPAIDRPAIYGQLAALVVEEFFRARQAEAPIVEAEEPGGGDRLLDVAEAAEVVGHSPRWVRDHAHDLPRVQTPGRLLRFSERRLKAWIKRRSYA
jgi:Helix-turn-helix domain